jgi:uncharacterized protein (DUF3820 family)
MQELIKIQSELSVPKNQRNNFGNYNYRSCEDILEALKPLLSKNNCVLTLSDEIKMSGDIVFVEATATIKGKDDSTSVTAQAGINPDRKGMDIAQSFGSSSSYARKYALNGLFSIDDTADSDVTNEHGAIQKSSPKKSASKKPLGWEDSMRTRKLGFGKHKDITWEKAPKDYLEWVQKQDGQYSELAKGELVLRSKADMNDDGNVETQRRLDTITISMKSLMEKIGKDKGLVWMKDKIGGRKLVDLSAEDREKIFAEFNDYVDSELADTDRLPF